MDLTATLLSSFMLAMAKLLLHRGRFPIQQMMGGFLLALTCLILSCGLLPGSRKSSQKRSPSPPPPKPSYIDQRSATGFAPPFRPPPPSRPAPNGPTLLGAAFGPGQAHAFVGTPFAGSSLPSLPFPWPNLASLPISIPFAAAPSPPPRAAPVPPRPGCGYVQVGAEQIPLDCPVPGYADILSAARAILSDTPFGLSPAHAGAAELPAAVDHRADGTEGPVRHQGQVGACSAFSFASAIDHALARRTRQPWAVSAVHLWSRYHEPSMSLPVENNRDRPLAAEQVWPYTQENQEKACTWASEQRCPPRCKTQGLCVCERPVGPCGQAVDAEKLQRADSLPMARFTKATRIEMDKTALMRALSQGQDIWMAMNFTYAAFDSDKLLAKHDGLLAVMTDFDPADTTSTHAMLIAGYRLASKGTYFLLHNSWGETWGDGGYAWIHETTLLKNIKAAYLVDAEPWDPLWSKVPPRQELPSQCPEGLLPDSITAQCTPPCSDGSARHNAACPNLSDCAPGYVNLYGECVVAAPKTQGIDRKTGIRYACAAAGCTYIAPFGVYGCYLPWCSISCPSPSFRLSAGPRGLSCTE